MGKLSLKRKVVETAKPVKTRKVNIKSKIPEEQISMNTTTSGSNLGGQSIENDFGFQFIRMNPAKPTLIKTPVKSKTVYVETPQNLKTTGICKVFPKTPIPLNIETLSTPMPSVLKNRRKSLRNSGIRSKRQSKGSNLVMIHPEISTKEYHKHINAELPGPIRMRQLLIWAFQRKLDLMQGDGQVVNRVKEFGNKIIEALQNQDLNTSWYQRQNHGFSPAVPVKPNPHNVELNAILQNFTRLRDALTAENELWEKLSTKQIEPFDVRTDFRSSNDKEFVNDLLQSKERLNLYKDIELWSKKLEPNLDNLDNSLKISNQFKVFAQSFCEEIFKRIFAQIFSKDNTNVTEPLILLRALSRSTDSN